jgi:hypothetical protein
MTKQNPSKIAEMALPFLFFLRAAYVTLVAVLGPPSLWMVAP